MRGSRTAALSIVTLTGAAVMLAGCSGASDQSATLSQADEAAGRSGNAVPESAQDSSVVSGSGALTDGLAGDTGEGKASGAGLLSEVPAERAVIATAEMTLRSQNVAQTVDALELITSAVGGFIAGRDISSNPDDPKGTRAVLLLRVPTDKLDTVIDRAEAEGDVVRVTADEQDVTETVVDVDSRVDSARASVERIRALLSQATTIGEVVRIEGELSRREADLESLLAQQRSLADQTSLATLSVTVLSLEAVEPVAEDETGFLAGLERGWEALVGVVVVALT
ncbi:MAG: DUF4349 domain-containing protein, partial [Actinomycetia bacterium]|nr:DUF4349 domain-containing protein [Actinomycetes bacterium]